MGSDDDPDLPTPIAEGGEISFIDVKGTTYEVHTFRVADNAELPDNQAAYTFKFRNGGPATVEVLAVGGGGGGDLTGSGGGAGRFVYYPAFNVETGTITVKVGDGGVGNGSGRGANGGDSEFIRDDNYKIVAPGGGVGGDGNQGQGTGSIGGSGGGTHNSIGTSAGVLSGTVPSDSVDGVLNLGNAGHIFIGGGAGEIAEDPSTYGKGVRSAISGTSQWYSGGGYRQDVGEIVDSPAGGLEWGAGRSENAESGTGDGGGSGSYVTGTDGGSGIVIVRFPVTAQ